MSAATPAQDEARRDRDRAAMRALAAPDTAPTVKREIRKFFVRKLWALRQLYRLYELFGDTSKVSALSPGEAQGIVAWLLDPGVPDVALCARVLWLDHHRPGWRRAVPMEAVGGAVRRRSPEVKVWRAAVLERDGGRCVECGSTERLHAHHLLRWVDAPALRLALENGRTLCAGCHAGAHSIGAAGNGSWL